MKQALRLLYLLFFGKIAGLCSSAIEIDTASRRYVLPNGQVLFWAGTPPNTTYFHRGSTQIM